jgi:hypothetical protein
MSADIQDFLSYIGCLCDFPVAPLMFDTSKLSCIYYLGTKFVYFYVLLCVTKNYGKVVVNFGHFGIWHLTYAR